MLFSLPTVYKGQLILPPMCQLSSKKDLTVSIFTSFSLKYLSIYTLLSLKNVLNTTFVSVLKLKIWLNHIEIILIEGTISIKAQIWEYSRLNVATLI